MNPGDQLRYGWIKGGKAAIPLPMAASEVKGDKGAGFVNIESGLGVYLDDQDTAECFGVVEAPAETTSSTAGGTRYNCIVDISAIYKIKVDTGTFTIADIGDTCDIGVTSNVQGAYLQSSSGEQIIVLNGDTDNNTWVFCMLNPADKGQTDSA